MQKISENETTRTWIASGEEAKTIFESHRTMLANLNGISLRCEEALKDLRTKHADDREALRLRQAEEAAALLKEQTDLEVEAAEPFHKKSVGESTIFHTVLYDLNPELTKIYMPMININQYEAGGGVITILEKYNDDSRDS